MTNNEATEILDQYRDKDTGIGPDGILSYPDGMAYQVRLMDVRQVYGRTDVMVMPELGNNHTVWVSIDRVQPIS